MMREKLTSAGYALREYQIATAEDAYAELERGRHVEIALPEAAGRSLIAQQAVWLWLKEHGRSRVLHVVGRRAQVEQQVALGRWMAPNVLTLGLASNQMRSPLAFRGIANAHRSYVSTPGLLINAIRRARFPRERISQIGLVILHEYESQLVMDDQGQARWHQDIIQLRRLLPAEAQLLLLATSSPLVAVDGGSNDPVAQSYAAMVRDELYPVSLHVDPMVYVQDAPIPHATFMTVRDDFVWGASEAIAWQARDVIVQIGAMCGREIDEAFVLANLAGIAGFRVNALRALDASDSTEIPINSDMRKVCYQVRSILGQSSYLVEDMFQGLVLHWNRVETKIGEQISSFDRPHLEDERQDDVFRAQIEGKGFALEQIIMDRPNKVGIIVTRHDALAEALREDLAGMDLKVELLEAGVAVEARESVLARFGQAMAEDPGSTSDEPQALLVATRESLGDGLDLPQVDYVLFYSLPTSEPSMWLELSRLRPLLDRASESIFLCYEGTSEAQSAQDLAQEMVCSGRGFEVVFEASS